ncbi:PAS domain S-box protein [Actimicrobium sp. CCI2.3]|uniref:bifunctional diguanylate cyclase/phosphodiesterase n=1 Tax=Actimicrobium sp. CCI2.3 TaxID=3048616 RepID=UPI002AB5D1C1|nr:PAS domain S-box protein [Actimicrobium sp. CCI2.3]MDY7574608.1 PAS domain S-box protein [Actimicrobium sp. CCI2.3]MEB0023893.1 PAS domain S-box protein [Actimicrobium sp. CCI2.3]
MTKRLHPSRLASRYSRSLIEASLDPLVTISAEGKITDVNTATEQVTGLMRTELVGSDFTDYFTDPVQAREGYQQVFAEGFVTDYPLAIRHRSGKITDVLYNASVYRDEAGQVLGVFAAARDVTERKKAEELLKRASQYSRSLIEASLDPLVTISAEGKITDVNTATEQVTGLIRTELVGSDFTDYFTDPVQAREGYQQVFAEGFVTDYPLAIRHRSGQITDVLYNASVYRDDAGQVLGIFAAARDVTERKKAEELLKRASQYSRSLIEASLDPLVTISAEGKITDVNTATEQVTGLMRTELVGSDFTDYFTDPVQAREGYQQVFAKGFVTDYPLAIRHRSGKITDVLYNASVYRDDVGRVLGIFAAARDVTERKRAESLVQAASVFTYAREGIVITNADGTILNVNAAFTRITGYGREEVLGRNTNLLGSGHQDKDFYAGMWADLTQKGHWYGEVFNRRKDGGVYIGALNIASVLGLDGKTEHYVGFFSDITASKEHQTQLEHIAHFDVLTNLPNRSLLADRLRQAMAQATRRSQLLAVVYIELDGFKAVNDRHGHDVGDQLLILLASAMKNALREGDTLARIGGDEFVAVLVDQESPERCAQVLARLVEIAAETHLQGDLVLQVSASLGVTFYPQADDIDADQLLRQADQTMYQAKLAGKNRYHIFDFAQDISIRGHHESLQRIRKALTKNEFVLHYQPKVNMRTGEVIGVEALIRWQHPERGLLPPAAFLPVIEDDPLAVEVGEWVINTVLMQMEGWRKSGLHVLVSVNVGARQLQLVDFVERLQKILARHPLINPSCLELELLETSALSDMEHVSRVIEQCAELGVMFSLDDFGTGYSSLTYLKRLHVKQIKIDRSFVRDMLEDTDDLTILKVVIGLAAAFKREVIAEGVETMKHGLALLKLGCELAQGYGIARPMPAEQILDWTVTWQSDPAWIALRQQGVAEAFRT